MKKSRARGWSVFDAIKTFPSSPETLMAEIDAAITSVEYAHATALLSPIPSSPSNTSHTNNHASSSSEIFPSPHDARLAEESYREACAALASGQPEAALRSIRVALASCPIDKHSAVVKLRSLASIATAQLQKQKNLNQMPI